MAYPSNWKCLGEATENIRTALHCFRKKKTVLDLSTSSGGSTLRKVFPNMGTMSLFSRKFLSEKPTELPSVEARQWRETRMHTFPMQGRNYRVVEGTNKTKEKFRNS